LAIYNFFDNFDTMELVIYSPNFYLHVYDAMMFIQYCIDGIVQIASNIKL